jgi:hypothetical protein
MHARPIRSAVVVAVLASVSSVAPALADDAAVYKPAPAPYSLPWQLRPAGVGTVARYDTSLASYQTADETGFAAANMMLFSYKLTPTLAPVARLGVVIDNQPGDVDTGAALVNPLLGVTWSPVLSAPWKVAAFGAVALPIGMGGDAPPAMDPTAAAAARGIPLRSAMDNAMFAVNYVTPLAGFDVAYVRDGLTLQAEVTVLQLLRARNEDMAPEAARTNSTFGLHAGYFVTPQVSLGGDLRYQRWLTTPGFVDANPAARDTVTAAFGPRFHFKLAGKRWLRPGISYTWAIDDPVAASEYRILQIDVPMSF